MVKAKRFRLFLLLSTLFGFLLLIEPTRAESNLSSPYHSLFLLVTILSIIVGVGVIAVWLLFILRYRESNVETVRTPLSHETARKLEMTWTTLAVLVVVILMILSYPVLMKVDDEATNPDVDGGRIVVVAHQFAFSFSYQDQYSVPKLRLTAGLTYLFVVTSTDVIHSLFIPDLHFKVDAVPGSYNSIAIEIKDPGIYDVWCNEYCGAGHSFMVQSQLIVEEA